MDQHREDIRGLEGHDIVMEPLFAIDYEGAKVGTRGGRDSEQEGGDVEDAFELHLV